MEIYTDSDLIIEQPIYPEGFKFEDEDCAYIAKYLYDGVNATFYNALKYNIIKTYRTWNDNFIPTVDFPVLKVYKSNENDDIAIAPQISTRFTISYALAYTQRPNIGSVSGYVGREIRRLLKNGSLHNLFQLDWNTPISVEYEDFIAPDNTIYKYATVTCNIYTIEA